MVLLALYVVLFLPFLGILDYLEGATTGMWSLSIHDLEYQLGAYAAFWVGWLLLSAPVVIGIFYVELDWLVGRNGPAWLAAPLACLAIFLGSVVMVSVLAAIVGGSWRAALLLLEFPFGFVVAAACYGLAGYHLLRLLKVLPGMT
jgi:hypothetical protein